MAHVWSSLAVAFLLACPPAALAQGPAGQGQSMPDSNMAPASGNSGAANNGVGEQGKLDRDAGSHASSVKGASAAAQLPVHPHPSPDAGGAKLEGDPAQGGGQQTK